MNYHNITKDDMLNGSGLRVVLWVSGCNHQCHKCQNPITWDASCGLYFGKEEMKELEEALSQDHIAGLTLSGGDPMMPLNRHDVHNVCKTIKEKFPDKNIWMYTGYLYEEIAASPILEYVDVLVDGKYVDELNDINACWVGSTNQRVIDVRKTVVANKVILWGE